MLNKTDAWGGVYPQAANTDWNSSPLSSIRRATRSRLASGPTAGSVPSSISSALATNQGALRGYRAESAG